MLLLSVYIIYRTNIIFEFIKEYVTTRKNISNDNNEKK